ncbi:hypothetical protein SR914_15270 [Comamonas testosteroni]|jgi:hypothetical protein|uniref:Uncharacterized protein n=2 Tax=Comamonas testosteroni TaxID=285 RepID=B7X0I8_COMTK|nr:MULTISPECIES: hypothetical protein [Comamonas]AIJ48088.1 hypothetical protein O987_19970 [Comamonas testosteroni TK102]EED66338.1 conserved hypothetical protein [Comamonas testosteroni KF-1]MPS90964.1 hypothetical protein [Comamonas sp.]NIF85085.1 hypothetical protein [Comamonas sp. Tr-654]WQG64589.1 hypothetical protein SR914_15270 [Comamonas testosteroni]
MKTLIATLMIAAPLVAISHSAVAQTAPKAKTAAAKKAPAVKKAPAKGKAAAAAAAGAGAAAVAAGPASAALGTEELAVAERVHKGRIACELGAYVNVNADTANPGYFIVDGRGFKYHMAPVKTSTGTVRLEDKAAGAVWLQIANKSMLMNQKAGQRLADECMSPEQQQVAEAIRKNPPPSLLDSK